MPPIRLAIIDTNILTCLGLQSLLADMMPTVDVSVFDSVDELRAQGEVAFFHYFVSSRIFFENGAFFRENPKKTIVLVNGDMTIAGMNTLNVCQSEKSLVRDIMSLQAKGRHNGPPEAHGAGAVGRETLLSARETEVAILLCKGCINKEIADQLDLAITTIITHRKNIMDKLHARSLADVIIYCVSNGIVNMEEL